MEESIINESIIRETEDEKLKRVIYIINSVILVIVAVLSTSVIIYLTTNKNDTELKIDFNHIKNVIVIVFSTAIVLFFMKLWKLPLIITISILYAYQLVYKTAVISSLNLNGIFKDAFSANLTYFFLAAIVATLFILIHYFIFSCYNFINTNLIYLDQKEEIQEEIIIPEIPVQPKKLLRLLSISGIKNFVQTNFFLVFFSLFDMTAIYYVKKIKNFGIFINILVSLQIYFMCLFFEYAIVYCNFVVSKLEYKRRNKTNVKDENAIVLYYSDTFAPENMKEEPTNTIRTRCLGFLTGMFASIPLYVLFPYSFIPGLPFQKKLRVIFRDGLNPAILRVLLNRPQIKLEKSAINLAEYIILLGFINFISLILVNKDLSNVVMLLLYKRVGFIVLDSIDVCSLCGIAQRETEKNLVKK